MVGKKKYIVHEVPLDILDRNTPWPKNLDRCHILGLLLEIYRP